MQEGRQNANRGKRVDKNTGRVIYDAHLKPGFYFRNFIHRRDYETNLFEILPQGFVEHCPDYICQPEKLTVTEADFEMCYASASTLLLRTHRPLTVQCRRFQGEVQETADSFTLYDAENHYGLSIRAAAGAVAVTVGADDVIIAMDADSEIRIDESYDPIAEVQPVPDFDACAAAQKQDYEAFLQRMPQPLKGDEALMRLAAYGLWSAVGFARGNYKRDCMLVSKNYMCGMWSWDHCFAAMALSTIDPARSWDQLMCVFDDQREDGRIPDCIEAVKVEWRYVKPPIHGLTLGILRQNIALTENQRREAYEKLSRWVMFWIDSRDLNGDGLPQYLHGNDSGWDNNTVFDKPGNIQSAELPAYLIQMIEELIPLAQEFDPAAVPQWKERAQNLKDAMLSQLFVNDLPIARLADTHEQVGIYSPLPYMSITLGNDLPEAARKAMLAKLDDSNFLTPYGIASEALNSPYYQLDGYSRGSIWSYGQFLPVVGLLKMGEINYAKLIMKGFLVCVRKGGFSECFCSKDGSGQRDRFLNWSVCVYVLFTQGGFIWDYMDQALWHTDALDRRVLGYGGDFADRNSDYNFSGNGIVYADGTEKPAMQDVRYWYDTPAHRAIHDARNAAAAAQADRTLAMTQTARKPKKLTMTEGDGNLGVKGNGFEILFSVSEAGVSSLKVKGTEWIWRAPRPAFWRASTDNDRGCGFPSRAAAWMAADVFTENKGFTVLKKSENGIQVRYTFGIPTVPGAEAVLTYTVEPQGTLRVEADYHGVPGAPELPCFGVKFQTFAPVTRTCWVGLSGETYPDRCKGGVFGCHEEIPHIEPTLVPQDCGFHVQTRQFTLEQQNICGQTTAALTVERCDAPFAFSALPNTAQEIEAAQHISELPVTGRTSVTIIGAARGVGGIDSWGSDVEDAYRISGEENHRVNFRIIL